MILVIGPNKSGKSALAERLATESHRGRVASSPGGMVTGSLIYLATMVPVDDDGFQRVAAHRQSRAGAGFVTIESPLADLDTNPGAIAAGDVVLLEDVSNLLANLSFATSDPQPVGTTCARVGWLARACRQLILVSIGGLTNQGVTDPPTRRFIADLNQVNQWLSERAERVIVLGDLT